MTSFEIELHPKSWTQTNKGVHFRLQLVIFYLVDKTGVRDRFIRGDRGFFILEESTMPAVLIEVGFMSNREELTKLLTAEYRMLIASSIYSGIVEAFHFPSLTAR